MVCRTDIYIDLARTLKRHARQDELDNMLEDAKSREAKTDINTRQHLSERSFANLRTEA
jgi:hypothetical protein